jgi:membrane-associated phospholipid phosphatase
MPGLDARHIEHAGLVDALVPTGSHASAIELIADLWLYAASAPLSALIVGGAAFVLRRRRAHRAAVLWSTAWLAGLGVEVLTKELLVRPALLADGIHVVAFDQSLPSGHALRSVLVAASVGYTWPRLRYPVAAWAASVAPLLVVVGAHTPTDVVAGLLLAALLVLCVREYAVRRHVDPRQRPVRAGDDEPVAAQLEHRAVQREP